MSNPIFTVSEFVTFTNAALKEAVFPYGVSVEGEVAEFRISQGKWIWFKLKDHEAVIECFATTWQLKAVIEDGLKVRVTAAPKIFGKSGKFSLNVYSLEAIGEGALRRAFELLKKKLTAEGIFDVRRKRLIPEFPETLGLITSSEAAAYSDFLRILQNRFGGIEVNFYHVQVQGQEAVADIVGAFNFFNQHPELAEVLVLTRGGGSLEDLQAFNSEEVVRAIFSSKCPVIVGVGHERDETLSDYVADLRAATPTNAAELVVRDRIDLINQLNSSAKQMLSSVYETLSYQNVSLLEIERTLERQIQFELGKFKDLFSRFQSTASLFLAQLQTKLNQINAWERFIKNLDPRQLLKRGYAVVRKNGRVVRQISTVGRGDQIEVQLYQGRFISKVEQIYDQEK